MISLIAAIGKNNELGANNALLWHLPADMAHFRDTTRGHTVIMGRKTFESIGKALPNRRNIVITRDKNIALPDIETFHSLGEVMSKTVFDTEVFVIGGAEIYKEFIDKTDKLYITHVDAEFKEADTFFPVIDSSKWQKIKSTFHVKDADNPYDMEFAEYERI
jgi:dihydrofolate reductase